MSDDNDQALTWATDHRLAEIRMRIAQDFYLKGPVLDVVAARIAASGGGEAGEGSVR